MGKPKSPKKSSRKKFDPVQYKHGVKAEDLILSLLQAQGHDLIEGLEKGKFFVSKNSDKYGVDLIIHTKNEDRTYTKAYGIEIVRRTNINYPTIYAESNKVKYYGKIPIFFIVVQADLKFALVLDCDKCIADYPSRLSNFNKEKSEELNYLIPRTEFYDWDLAA